MQTERKQETVVVAPWDWAAEADARYSGQLIERLAATVERAEETVGNPVARSLGVVALGLVTFLAGASVLYTVIF